MTKRTNLLDIVTTIASAESMEDGTVTLSTNNSTITVVVNNASGAKIANAVMEGEVVVVDASDVAVEDGTYALSNKRFTPVAPAPVAKVKIETKSTRGSGAIAANPNRCF